METERSRVLPEDYYVANFHALASFVCRTYEDILAEAELSWYTKLTRCSKSAQCLYIRLVTRRRSVFRLRKLNYPEIGNVHDAAAELAAAGLASTAGPESLAVVVAAYTKPELVHLLDLDNSRSLPRASLVQQIVDSSSSQCSKFLSVLQQSDEWVSVVGHEHWTLFRLCFFGNLYQDGSEFVLSQLGTVIYERYEIDMSSRPFQTRAQLEAHLRYFECEALIDTVSLQDASQLNALVATLPPAMEKDVHLIRRLDRFRNRIARQFERLNQHSRALELYAQSVHPPARERQVRLHLSKGDVTAAKLLFDRMLAEPFNDVEAHAAHRLQRLINKASGITMHKARPFRPASTRLTLETADCRVERAAQQFYSRFGHCFYCENSLVSGVLGLFIWDIIFHPVKGAFFNPFQHAPADFHEPSFVQNREHLLVQRFRELEQPLKFASRVMIAYDTHRGKANPLVRWGRLCSDLLSVALQNIPSEHWLAMFNRLLNDMRENTSGFPDLVLFREEGGYEFIEIKGPGDALQQNQRRWMQYFDEHRIPCRVVNVRWASKTDCV